MLNRYIIYSILSYTPFDIKDVYPDIIYANHRMSSVDNLLCIEYRLEIV
jgi:hypothetical protein